MKSLNNLLLNCMFIILGLFVLNNNASEQKNKQKKYAHKVAQGSSQKTWNLLWASMNKRANENKRDVSQLAQRNKRPKTLEQLQEERDYADAHYIQQIKQKIMDGLRQAFEKKDSKKELALLRQCEEWSNKIFNDVQCMGKFSLVPRKPTKNECEVMQVAAWARNYSLTLRLQHKTGISPLNVIHRYFEGLSQFKNADNELYKMLQNAACNRMNNEQKAQIKSCNYFFYNHSLFKRLPLDLRAKIRTYLINKYPYDNYAPRRIYPPLESATDVDNTQLVVHCLNAGCSWKGRDEKNRTPLERALQLGKMNSVQGFIAFGIPDFHGQIEKYCESATTSGHPQVPAPFRTILARARESLSEQLAIACLERYSKANPLRLLRLGADPNVQEKAFGQVPLFWAISDKAYGCMEILLNAKADPNATYKFVNEHNEEMYHPLLDAAIQRRDATATMLLLSRNANPNEKDGLNNPLICNALDSKHEAVIGAMIQYKADIQVTCEAQEEDGELRQQPLLAIFLARNNEIAIKALLNAGANPQAKDTFGKSLMRLALESENAKIVRLMLDFKADPNGHIEVIEQETNAIVLYSALIYACATKSADVILVLLQHGANPNAADSYGKVVLSHAADTKDPSILKLLLDFKADPLAKSRPDQETCMQQLLKTVHADEDQKKNGTEAKNMGCIIKSANAKDYHPSSNISFNCKNKDNIWMCPVSQIQPAQLLFLWGVQNYNAHFGLATLQKLSKFYDVPEHNLQAVLDSFGVQTREEIKNTYFESESSCTIC